MTANGGSASLTYITAALSQEGHSCSNINLACVVVESNRPIGLSDWGAITINPVVADLLDDGLAKLRPEPRLEGRTSSNH